MRFQLKTRDGRKISSSLTNSDLALLSEVTSESRLFANGKCRAGRIASPDGEIIAFTNDPDFLRSSQAFKNTARCILAGIKFIDSMAEQHKVEANKNVSRLLHNLISLNAHNIQEIYSLIPQEDLSGTTRGHVELVKRKISNSPTEASKVFLRLAKNNAAMKAEFSVFKKLFIAKPDLRPSKHIMHKVLMNVLYLFFQDFTDKNVEVNLTRSDSKAYLDYESMHVALYHLIDNTAKYTKPNSRVQISIESQGIYLTIQFRMTSMRIRPEERELVFEEGYSGQVPKLSNRAGDGIGMNIAKRLIEANGGKIWINSIEGTVEIYNGMEYQQNEFFITVPN